MNRRVSITLAIVLTIGGVLAIRSWWPVHHRVSLTWHAPPPEGAIPPLRYNVYRSEDGGQSYTPIARGLVGTSYEDAAVTRRTIYFYSVTTIDANGRESVRSQPIRVKVP